jgi:DNA-binding LacI/PurR family transcriptional regulator
MRFVRTLAHEAEASGDLAGFLLIRPNYEVQEFFHEHRARFPAVVLGHVYPGITGLPWVDGDQGQIARLAVEFVLRRGHRRVAVLRNEHWAPGDNAFMDGLIETFEMSRGQVSLAICGLPPYELPIRHCVRELLSSDERPTAIVVHTAFQDSLVMEVVKELGLRVPDEIDVIKGGLGFGSPFSESIPHAVSELSMREIGTVLGQMLVSLRQGEQPNPFHLMFPVKFTEREM